VPKFVRLQRLEKLEKQAKSQKMINLGAKKGFMIIPNLEITIAVEDLGNNIFRALSLCE
jgi:hypothetical protein